MPIKKETSARLVKRNVTHDAISRSVVESISGPTALAIYVYLLCKPPDWVVRRQDILDRFDIGRHRYDEAMRELRDLGLVWVATMKDESGRIIGNEIIVEQTGNEPKVGLSDHREKPTSGKSDHLKKKRLPTEEEIGIRGWDEWVNYRQEIRKKMTDSTVSKQAKLLNQYPPETQQAIINQSIQNGWTGLFPLKEKGNGKTGPTGSTRNRTLSDDLTDTSWAE